jgi:16S rRNA (cytidine1402-2'-O)-methyltransferase
VAAGTLYVVATPIGNLGDITLRAIETLRAVDRVIAEDTRRTRGLLSHFGIAGKYVDRLDANAEAHDIARAVTQLEAGESLALCTDAGTPIVSDPGTALVRAAIAAGATVVPIPGASAVLAAIALSGLVTGGFRFLGFLARSGPERREEITRIVETPESVVIFESPQRTEGTIVELAQAMPDRDVVIARELTKLHEEAVRGTLAELAAQEKREWLGEVTIVLGPARARVGPGMSDEAIDARIDEELALGRRAKDVSEAIAIESGRPKREIYGRVVARRG